MQLWQTMVLFYFLFGINQGSTSGKSGTWHMGIRSMWVDKEGIKYNSGRILSVGVTVTTPKLIIFLEHSGVGASNASVLCTRSFPVLLEFPPGSPQLVYVKPVEKPTYYQEFRCITEPEVENTKYSWRRQDWSGLPEGVKAEGDRLHFLRSGPDLNGVYICEVKNQKGTAVGSLLRHQEEKHSEL